MNVGEAPRVERPLSLICGPCGAKGKYSVGTVTVDMTRDRLNEPGRIHESVGFTGYFRCRKCDAGGPWKLTAETTAYVTALMIGAQVREQDLPLIFGSTATYDGRKTRYATDAEDHLKRQIEREPDRAFLWVRLGNMYSHVGLFDRAEYAYLRAIEFDPADIEAHAMYGKLLRETDRLMDSVPHLQAALKHVRDAHHVNLDLRRNLVRASIAWLLEAHAQSNGQTELLPPPSPEELKQRNDGEPLKLEIRELDLNDETDFDYLCESFLRDPRGRPPVFRRRSKRPRVPQDDPTLRIHRPPITTGRNAPCPCGSGHKYKKCCDR